MMRDQDVIEFQLHPPFAPEGDRGSRASAKLPSRNERPFSRSSGGTKELSAKGAKVNDVEDNLTARDQE